MYHIEALYSLNVGLAEWEGDCLRCNWVTRVGSIPTIHKNYKKIEIINMYDYI